MTIKSLADRVAALEAKVGNKSIDEQFRAQAELIDRMFDYRFEEQDKKLAPRFATMERAIGEVQSEVGTLRQDVSTLRKDVSSLQKDLAVVREGISVLLKRPPQ